MHLNTKGDGVVITFPITLANQVCSLPLVEECLALSRIDLAALFCNNWTLAIRVLLCLSPHTISL